MIISFLSILGISESSVLSFVYNVTKIILPYLLISSFIILLIYFSSHKPSLTVRIVEVTLAVLDFPEI